MHQKWSDSRHLFDQGARLMELGDVLWSLVLLGSLFDWSLEQMVAANVAKLRKRSPEGFEAARSVHRDARAMSVRGTVLGRSNRGGTPPVLPPLGTLRACMVLFLGMVGDGRVRRLPCGGTAGRWRCAEGLFA
jgi:MazG nucleotide pyrophosphohydrolase domain